MKIPAVEKAGVENAAIKQTAHSFLWGAPGDICGFAFSIAPSQQPCEVSQREWLNHGHPSEPHVGLNPDLLDCNQFNHYYVLFLLLLHEIGLEKRERTFPPRYAACIVFYTLMCQAAQSRTCILRNRPHWVKDVKRIAFVQWSWVCTSCKRSQVRSLTCPV